MEQSLKQGLKQDFVQMEQSLEQRLEEKMHTIIDDMVRDVMLPAFAGLESRLDKVESRLDGVENRLSGIDRKLTTMPDRDDLDRIIANVNGETILKFRKQQQQISLIADDLHDADIFTDLHVSEIKKLDIFPSLRVS